MENPKKRGQIALSASSFIAPTVPAWVFVCSRRVRRFFYRAWSQKMKELHGFTRIQSDIWTHKRCAKIYLCTPVNEHCKSNHNSSKIKSHKMINCTKFHRHTYQAALKPLSLHYRLFSNNKCPSAAHSKDTSIFRTVKMPVKPIQKWYRQTPQKDTKHKYRIGKTKFCELEPGNKTITEFANQKLQNCLSKQKKTNMMKTN